MLGYGNGCQVYLLIGIRVFICMHGYIETHGLGSLCGIRRVLCKVCFLIDRKAIPAVYRAMFC